MKSASANPSPKVWPRLPLLAFGILALLSAIWGGLIRVPVVLPLPVEHAHWITFHGPLMVSGFLGTVIGLERAAGLPDRWTFLPPILTGAGALALVLGMMGGMGPLLITLGSAVFVAVTWRVVQLRAELFTITMSLGAVAWLIGNVLWLFDWPFHRIVPWWVAFLALTILGERLDLSRFQKQEAIARPLFFISLAAFVIGVMASALTQTWGERMTGVGLVALAIWLTRFDIARRTLVQPGLPRFMSLCLLLGFAWMAAAGMLFILGAPLYYGFIYDAALHAFFLGFVFSMIFGHAPVIFPSVLLMPVAFHRRFYLHVGVLHISVLLRVAGDLASWAPGRQWGAILNGVAIVLFLANTLSSIIGGRLSRRRTRERQA
jgi:hypothetical protein